MLVDELARLAARAQERAAEAQRPQRRRELAHVAAGISVAQQVMAGLAVVPHDEGDMDDLLDMRVFDAVQWAERGRQ